MKRIKREQYFNDPSYDSATDNLLQQSYELVEKLSKLLQEKKLSGIALQAETLYLRRDGGWEVQNDNKGAVVLSPYTDIEVVLGHYLAPDNEENPSGYFFKIEPDIKRTQAAQILLRSLESAIDSVTNAEFFR